MVEPGESLSEFIEHVMEDQEEGLQLHHQSSQVLVSLLLLVERADTYRARLGTEVERGELLEQGLTQLEDACERVRRFVEGTEPSEHEDGAVMTQGGGVSKLKAACADVDMYTTAIKWNK